MATTLSHHPASVSMWVERHMSRAEQSQGLSIGQKGWEWSDHVTNNLCVDL